MIDPAPAPAQRPDVIRGVQKRLLQIISGFLVEGLILFGAAGRLNWNSAWLLIIIQTLVVLANAVVLIPRSPELIAERSRLPISSAKKWDPPLAFTLSAFGPMTIWLIAGLDVRFGWQPAVPLAVRMVAVFCVVIGYGIVGWAMASNRFFSGLVRIQTERAHRIETGGPYQYIRHPGYAGMMLFTLATPLLLGSWWACIPALLTAIVAVVRTRLEDRMLTEELAGYQVYTTRVRFRLIPGLW